jgi:hypothetical protein
LHHFVKRVKLDPKKIATALPKDLAVAFEKLLL